MTASDNGDGQGRSDLELLRLTRLSGEYDASALQSLLATARAWVSGKVDLTPSDTAFLAEGLFKCGRLTESVQVAKQRLARGEPSTAYDEFAQQYQRLAAYDFALPSSRSGGPLFPPTAAAVPRVLSLYHSSITFQTTGYTVRTQALLQSSQLDVVPLTRIGYPWAAKIAKSTVAKVGKRTFETNRENVCYRHRHGQVTNQSHTFGNIALSKHEILKAIAELRPHVVHAASNFVNALPALLAAREAGLPFVYEMRGLWELTAGVGIPGWLESERYLLERRIETFVATEADRVIVLSAVQKGELIERGVDEAKIRVVINGHEPQRVSSGSAALAQHCPGLKEWIGGRTVIGYAGAIAIYEGLQDLVATLAEQRSAQPNVVAVIAGDGPYLYQLQAQVASLGLEDRVKLLGRVPPEVADALYGIVDLCILPRLPDPVSQLITPLKTVEILSHGKVLLASNVGAIAEQLQRYGYGETFVAGDRADLGRQLTRVLADLPALKLRYAGATARIDEGFSWATITRKWDALLTEVASRPAEQSGVTPARAALAPLYDDRPVRLLEAVPLWVRIARSQLVVEGDHTTYLRYPAELEGRVRLVAVADGAELGQPVTLGPVRPFGGARLRDVSSLAPGTYQVFVYVALEYLAAAVPGALGWMETPGAWYPVDVSESRTLVRWERRRFLACELEHDAKHPTELDIMSEHAEPVRVAASYIPLVGAELNDNFTQRTKSKVTGTRFHYITVTPGNSELALFPRMSGRLIVELTPWGDGEIIENRLRQIARVRSVPRDGSLFPQLDRSRKNILIAANVNETLLDGSTIWLKTLANTLARQPDVNVYIASNALHVPNGVTAELFDKPNVAKIDLTLNPSDRAGDMANQVRLLDRTAGGFDLIIVRGIDIAKGIVDRSMRDRVVYYGAGMFRRTPEGGLEVDERALNVGAKSSGVIFQNAEMARMFREQRPDYAGACYCISPCVEESALATARRKPLPPLGGPDERLVVYAGKLIREYGVLELVTAVQQRIAAGNPTRLVVLGNKFDGRDPAYQEELESALRALGPAATWLPAVPPSVALAWVQRADAVWGWRHGEFETSHFEISTKMVEGITCGAPIVLYPAPANVALMGQDYPGFGEQSSDAAAALERLLGLGRAGFAALSERLRGRFEASEAYRPLLERVSAIPRRPARGASSAKPGVLVAGHDFRFFEDIEAYLMRDGHAVTREYWKNHTVRFVHGQDRAVERADIVFCEWCLGNAVWWSNHLPAGKRLIIRLHLQEINTPHPGNVDWSRVEKLIFISPHVMRQAIEKFGIPAHKCQVIPISVRLNPGAPVTGEALARRRDTLGMVGLTPWRKRPDKALELLLALRQRYPNLRLLLKGHTPSEYAWMSNRKDELSLYQGFFREIAPLERSGVVQISGYDDQLEAFYREVGWILSLSDFEGCHTAVAEGGVMGCLPLMTNWGGAEEVYSPELVQADSSALQRYFDEHYASFDEHSRQLRARFEKAFGLDHVFEQWRRLFAGRSGADGARAVESQQLFVDR